MQFLCQSANTINRKQVQHQRAYFALSCALLSDTQTWNHPKNDLTQTHFIGAIFGLCTKIDHYQGRTNSGPNSGLKACKPLSKSGYAFATASGCPFTPNSMCLPY